MLYMFEKPEIWPSRPPVLWLAYTESGRSNACLSVVGGYVNVSHEMDSNLNISPKMSYGVLECDMVMWQNYMLMIL